MGAGPASSLLSRADMALVEGAQVSSPEGVRTGPASHRLQHLGEWAPHFGQHSGAGSGGMGVGEPPGGHESRRADSYSC